MKYPEEMYIDSQIFTCIDAITEEILMIDLTGKSVFVRTQEEYSKVLRIAKLQGFRWARGKTFKRNRYFASKHVKFS